VIDFRYHLVSIVAIFLALTVGIVLGSTVLEPMFFKSAEELTETLRQNNERYLTQISQLQAQQGGSDALITAHAPELVRDRLAGERVVLVEAPGAAASLREPLEKVVTDAGAVYTGRVSLTDKFIAADQVNVLGELADAVAPAGLEFAPNASAYQKAAAVLASAIVTSDRAEAGHPNPAAAQVLEAFEKGDFLTVGGDPRQRATLAIVLAPAQRYEGEDAARKNAAIVAVAAGLDAAGLGTVVAGGTDASAGGGVIAALHDTGGAASAVSTVDTVDTAAGRIVVIYALREQLDGGSGSYGIGDGASAFEPELAHQQPSPSAAGG